MEKKERVKYYPISLKDKKLHNEFMILERTKGFQNVDDTLRYLMEGGKLQVELKIARKENEMLQEIRELIFEPIKHHMQNSTPEEIDSLDLCEGKFMVEMEKRVKKFWKRFALKEAEDERDKNILTLGF